LSGGTWTYTVNGLTSGSYPFSVRAFDDLGAFTEASFTGSVDGNAPPTISDVANQSINQGQVTAVLDFTVGDDATTADSLVVTATSSNPTLVPDANIVLGGSGAEVFTDVVELSDGTVLVAGSADNLDWISALQRDGFAFAGWNSAYDGSGLQFPSGASYTTEQNDTLFAHRTEFLDPFALWIGAYPEVGALDGPGDDAEGDGIPNLIEYALGGDPTRADRTILPVVDTTTASGEVYLRMTFRRDRGEVDYAVKCSDVLTTWTVIATNPGSFGESVSVTDGAPINTETPRFLRLVISVR